MPTTLDARVPVVRHTRGHDLGTREGWLRAATAILAERIREATGLVVPPVRVSAGFGTPTGGLRVIGACWTPAATVDGVQHVLISPILGDGARVLDVLAHELLHAALPAGTGHGAPFARAALALGLDGPPTATVAGAPFTRVAAGILPDLGPWPHGRLTIADGRVARGPDGEPLPPGRCPGTGGRGDAGPRPQGTRMIRCACDSCGYLVRTTARWLSVGAPICPVCVLPLTPEA